MEKSCLDMQLGQIRQIKLTATRLPGHSCHWPFGNGNGKASLLQLNVTAALPFTP